MTCWNKNGKQMKDGPSPHDAGRGVDEVRKGAWWMPRLPQATKGAASCEKPRVGASGP